MSSQTENRGIVSDVPFGLNEPLTPEGAAWRQQLKDALNPMSDCELKEILGITVRHDDSNKIITFLSLLNTYTDSDQVNIGFIAESSTGKSYIPLEIANGYFPKEDVVKLGYASPTAFFHEYGTMLPDPTDKREDVEPEKKRKIVYIDLEKKILIFLDQPHSQLLEHLRPLLSHDEREITVKITDKRKSGLHTKTIVIRGFPTVVFCSAKANLGEQEKTRLLMLSPEVSQEKIREGIALRLEKESNREVFETAFAENPKRRYLANRVSAIRLAQIKQVIIPEELRAKIYEKFMESHDVLQSRNQRDISRLLSIIKGYALLNYQSRHLTEDKETGKTVITATDDDVLTGFRYYSEVSEANELGIPPEIWELYKLFKEEMENSEIGLSNKDIQRIYFTKIRKPLGSKKLKKLTDMLETSGLWTSQTDPNDKRMVRYIPPEGGVCEENTISLRGKSKLTSYSVDTPTPGGI